MNSDTMRRTRPLFFAGDELHFAKLEKARAVMSKWDFDALVFILPEAVRYLSDIYTLGPRVFWEYSYLVFLTKKEIILCYTSGSDDYRVSQIKDLVTGVRRFPKFEKWPEVIEKLLVDHGIQKAKIGVDVFPFELYVELHKRLPDIEFQSASGIWKEFTAVKHPLEIALIRRAIEIAEIGMKSAVDGLREGRTELSVAMEAEYAMKRESDGSEISPFIPIVSITGTPERAPTPAILKSGLPIMIDLGAVYRGYTGEFGRTTIIGVPNSKQKEAFQAVLKSVKSAFALVRPGVKCSDIDKKARDVLAEAGFGKYMHTRATGHQLGYGLHSDPLIGPEVDEEIQENMIINLEPRLVFNDESQPWKIHIEDTALVTRDGYEYLTSFIHDPKFLS